MQKLIFLKIILNTLEFEIKQSRNKKKMNYNKTIKIQ